MVTSYTPNLNLAKPLVNGPETENTWGFDLNANADKLDAFAASVGPEFVDDRVAQLLKAGPNVGLQYNDFGNTITISATGSMTVLDPGEGAVFFATRTHALPMSLDAAVKTFHTGGFSVEGDGGHGVYARYAGTPTDPTNPGFVHLADNSWWRLVAQGGEVYAEQFGYKADWNGTTGTDNWPAIQYAKAFTAYVQGAARYSYAILVPPGDAYFGQTVSFFEVVQIKAHGGGMMNVGGPQQVRWHFPNTISWMVFHQNNTGPGEDQAIGGVGSSTGSVIEGISCVGVGDPTHENLNLRGVLMRTMVHLRNVQLYNCAGDAYYIRAYAGAGGMLEGNANCWRMEYCLAHSPKGEFLRVEGADANAGVAINFVTHGGGGGCGIRNQSYYVNTYLQTQITGYGNNGVHRAGKRYVLIDPAAGAGAATTPGTNNNIWYHFANGSADANYPEWSATPTKPHKMMCPVWDSGGGSVYNELYVETGNGHPSHVLPQSLILNGNAVTTIYSGDVGQRTQGLLTKLGVGASQQFPSGSPEYTATGGSTFCIMGRVSEEFGWGTDGGMQIFTHARAKDSGGATAQFGYYQNDLVYRYLSQQPYWICTTTSTTKDFGTGVPQPYRLQVGVVAFNDHYFNGARTVGMATSAPPDGAHAWGEFRWNMWKTAALNSPFGWVCTTAGTPGTWTPLYSGPATTVFDDMLGTIEALTSRIEALEARDGG